VGVIFEKPLLDSIQCTVKDKTFTLYEINGVDYWDHVLSAETFAKPVEEEEPEEQTAQERYLVLRGNAKKRIYLVACSLKPNYPEVDINSLKGELSTMLKMQDQQKLYSKLEELMGWTNPNSQAPDEDSSTD